MNDLPAVGSKRLFEVGVNAVRQADYVTATLVHEQLRALPKVKAQTRARRLGELIVASGLGRNAPPPIDRAELQPHPRPQLVPHVRAILDHAEVVWGGRTYYPERRNFEHASRGLSHLSVIQYACGTKQADDFERALLQLLRVLALNKVLNPASDRGGGGPTSGGFHAIYIAWLPRGRGHTKAFRVIENNHSDPSQRICWPDSGSPDFEPLHLQTQLTQEDAAERVRALVQAQKAYYARTRH